jgi:mRNA interferase MazF
VRGDVFEIELTKAKGREQAGPRFGVVLQSDVFSWSTLVVAPTSGSARPGPIRPEVVLGDETTVVLVDQMQAVDPALRLGRMVGRLSLADMQAVDSAIKLVLAV